MISLSSTEILRHCLATDSQLFRNLLLRQPLGVELIGHFPPGPLLPILFCALVILVNPKILRCLLPLQLARRLRARIWRGVRDSNPRGPTDHRLSRPAPYQARVTPLKFSVFLSLTSLDLRLFVLSWNIGCLYQSSFCLIIFEHAVKPLSHTSAYEDFPKKHPY